MKKINNILNNEEINTYRYTIKSKAVIVDTDKGKFVLKENNHKNNNIEDIYLYLKSRNFDYYPKLLKKEDRYNVYEYVEGIKMPYDQKVLDMVFLLTLLHNKTTYYKEVDIYEYKEIYEKTMKEIEDVYSHYNNLMNNIEKEIYMSPSYYLIARNISKVFASLQYSKNEIDNWYELVKNKNRQRRVTLYNNVDVDHLIRNDNLYLINWEKSKEDIPIYDFYSLYKKYALDFDFNELLKIYEEKYPFLEEEKKLLFIKMCIPDKIEFNKNELYNCIRAKEIIDYIYKTETLLFPHEEPNEENQH